LKAKIVRLAFNLQLQTTTIEFKLGGNNRVKGIIYPASPVSASGLSLQPNLENIFFAFDHIIMGISRLMDDPYLGDERFE
jgi:hypothetical protein